MNFNMPRLPVIPAKELFRLLVKFGCLHVSTEGSHFKIENPRNGARTTIPVHGNRDLGKGFFKRILDQLEIDVDEFLEFMKKN